MLTPEPVPSSAEKLTVTGALLGCPERARADRGRRGVVDEHGDGGRGEDVAGVVGRRHAQVVLAVGDGVRAGCRVPASPALAVHVPAPAGAALEDDRVDARAAASAELLVSETGAHADLGAVRGGGDRAGRERVVDADGDRGGGEGVAGVVGGDDAEVVWPSATVVVSKLAAWFVQVPAPAGERWNWTVATPELPVSAELL